MKISKVSHVTSAKHGANKWSMKDDFTLVMLVGSHTYEEIALALGRSPQAVQRRASRKGLNPRSQAAAETAANGASKKVRETARLKVPEEDLSAFAVTCDEEPVLPVAGGREYNREYKRNQRAKEKP